MTNLTNLSLHIRYLPTWESSNPHTQLGRWVWAHWAHWAQCLRLCFQTYFDSECRQFTNSDILNEKSAFGVPIRTNLSQPGSVWTLGQTNKTVSVQLRTACNVRMSHVVVLHNSSTFQRKLRTNYASLSHYSRCTYFCTRTLSLEILHCIVKRTVCYLLSRAQTAQKSWVFCARQHK